MKSILHVLCCLFAFNTYAQDIINSSAANFEDQQPKAFSINLFSLGGYSDSQFREGSPSMDFFDNYISFNYKVNRDFRVGARPSFGYSTAGKNYRGEEVTDKIRTRDFSLTAKFSNLFEDSIVPALELSNQFRLYLPTSDSSRDSGMIARLRSEAQASYRFSRGVDVRYYAKPSYYFQRTTANVMYYPDRPTNPVLRTTQFMDLEHGGEFNYDLNRYFAIKPGFEFQEKWSNASAAENLEQYHSSVVRTGIGLEIAPSRGMNFTVGIDSTRDLIRTDVTPETGYTLMTNITLY